MTATVAVSKYNCDKNISDPKKILKNKSSEDNKNSTLKQEAIDNFVPKELMIIIGIPKYFSYPTRHVSLPLITSQMNSSPRRDG